MATIQEVLAVVEAEKVEVAAKLEALAAEVAALKEQVTAGAQISAEQLDTLKAAVENIFTPSSPVVEQPGIVDPI